MENPYQSIAPENKSSSVFQDPQSGARSGAGQGLEANSVAQGHLISIKGWLRFLSVLGFLTVAIMMYYMYILLAWIGFAGGGFGVLILLVMVVMGILTFSLSLRLTKYANAIGRMNVSRSPIELENAIIEQMKFWRLAGILVIVLLIFVLIGLVS